MMRVVFVTTEPTPGKILGEIVPKEDAIRLSHESGTGYLSDSSPSEQARHIP
jgi:hypothetical protein